MNERKILCGLLILTIFFLFNIAIDKGFSQEISPRIVPLPSYQTIPNLTHSPSTNIPSGPLSAQGNPSNVPIQRETSVTQPQQMQQKTQQILQPSLTPLQPSQAQQGLQPTQQIPQVMPQPQTTITLPETTTELSELELFIRGRLPADISVNVNQFGYDLFRTAPTTFAPVENIPVGPEYIIGPGDEIRITVWGGIEGTWSSVVDRGGNIHIPKVGTLSVAGLTFAEAKEVINREFSKYYKDFEMNVTIGKLRTITVYVVGFAKSPGAYTVSSLSTLVNALFAAGGPSKAGSMRNIKLYRNGKLVVEFDMYDFLLRGDKSKDVRLLPEDVIFISSIGPVAAIVGNVKRPAIYEMKEKTTLMDLIKMAGGLNPTAYLQRLQIERIYQNEVKIVKDVTFKDISEIENIFLEDGDNVKVFPIRNVVINAVTLKGNVAKPGIYQWFEGMRISDLIKDPNKDLLPETYFDYAIIERLIPPDYHTEIVSFNLKKAIFEKDEKENKVLQPYDVITIFNKWELMEKPKVRIAGAVNKPGEYDYRENMRVSDLIALAGGLKHYAYLEKAELTRVVPTNKGPQTERIYVNLKEVLKGSLKDDLVLQRDDYLFVRTVPEWTLYRTITIDGEVRFPGTYTVKRGERLSDLIERAGGFTDKAYPKGAIFIRKKVQQEQQKSLDDLIMRLEREVLIAQATPVATAISPEEVQARKLEMENIQKFIRSLKDIKATGRVVIRLAHPRILKNSEYDVELEDGDFIYIPPMNPVVNVMGAVMNMGSFIYSERYDWKDYIFMAGSLSPYADEDKIYVIKADGRALPLKKKFFSWNFKKERWELSPFVEDRVKIEPGDTIIVPEKIERIAWLREIKNITQILMQIAVTAGIVIQLF